MSMIVGFVMSLNRSVMMAWDGWIYLCRNGTLRLHEPAQRSLGAEMTLDLIDEFSQSYALATMLM